MNHRPQFHIIGAGQLARMLALSNLHKGYEFNFYTPFEPTPVEGLGNIVKVDENYAQLSGIFSSLNPKSDNYITFESENLPESTFAALKEIKISSTLKVYPDPGTLHIFSDRYLEKSFLNQNSIPTTRWLLIEDVSSLTNCGLEQSGILKLRTGGFDGRGQIDLAKEPNSPLIEKFIAAGAIVEEKVSFIREVSLVTVASVKNPATHTFTDAHIECYPLSENVHKAGILVSAKAIFEPTLQKQAEEIAKKIINATGYIGVLAIEFFVTNCGLVVNEVAPRVHNSGHWTIESQTISQFAGHIEAILGPVHIGEPHYKYIKTYNLIGSIPRLPRLANSFLHDYRKTPRDGRKVGHVTVVDNDEEKFSQSCGILDGILRID